jgi:hypothetical protein
VKGKSREALRALNGEFVSYEGAPGFRRKSLGLSSTKGVGAGGACGRTRAVSST